jgi:alkylation response protein AidB-like acyl-CoA dehydrogenase
MNLQLSDEQKLLRDSAVRWVAAQVAAGAQGAAAGGEGRRERWSAMAGFGWLAMTLPLEHDGLGQSLGDACVLAEALGAGPLADPYLAAIVQAAELIATGASPAQQARWLPDIASGKWLVVPADIERGAPSGSAGPRTRAKRAGAGWQLDGQKSVVPCGDGADAWLVSARDDAGASVCFLVPRGTAGVHAQDFESVDGAGACALTFKSVALDDQALLAAPMRALRGAPSIVPPSPPAPSPWARCRRCSRPRSNTPAPASSSASPWRSIRSFAIGWPTCQWPATKPDR